MAKKRIRKRTKKDESLDSLPASKDDYEAARRRILDLFDAASIIKAKENTVWSLCGEIYVAIKGDDQEQDIGYCNVYHKGGRIALNLPQKSIISYHMSLEKFKVIPKQHVDILYFEPIEEETTNKLNYLYTLIDKENAAAIVDYDGDRILSFIPSRPEIMKYYGLNNDFDGKKYIAVLVHLTDVELPLDASEDVYYSSDLTETNPKSAIISLIAKASLNTQQLREILKTIGHPEKFPVKDTEADISSLKEQLGQKNKVNREKRLHFDSDDKFHSENRLHNIPNIYENRMANRSNNQEIKQSEVIDSASMEGATTEVEGNHLERKESSFERYQRADATSKRIIGSKLGSSILTSTILTSNVLKNGVNSRKKSPLPQRLDSRSVDSHRASSPPSSRYSHESKYSKNSRKRKRDSSHPEFPAKKRNYSLENLEHHSDQSLWSSSNGHEFRRKEGKSNGHANSPPPSKKSQKDSSGKRVVHKNQDSTNPTQTLWIGFGYSKTPVDYNTLKRDFDFGSLETVNFLQNQKCAFVNYRKIEDAILAKEKWEGSSKYPKICYKVYSAKYPTDNDGQGHHQKKTSRH